MTVSPSRTEFAGRLFDRWPAFAPALSSRASFIESRRGANGYRLFETRDLAKLLAGKVNCPRRVPLDRVHRCSFLKNSLVDDCLQLVFLRPPTAVARAGIHPDRFVAFIRPYLEKTKLGAPFFAPRRVGDGRFCETFPVREPLSHPFLRKGWGTRGNESMRQRRDLYMVDLIKLAIDEIGLVLIDEFCRIRSRVAHVRLGPRRLPDGWMRCLHFSPSSETYPGAGRVPQR